MQNAFEIVGLLSVVIVVMCIERNDSRIVRFYTWLSKDVFLLSMEFIMRGSLNFINEISRVYFLLLFTGMEPGYLDRITLFHIRQGTSCFIVALDLIGIEMFTRYVWTIE